MLNFLLLLIALSVVASSVFDIWSDVMEDSKHEYILKFLSHISYFIFAFSTMIYIFAKFW